MAGDFNNDGRIDLATLNAVSNHVLALLGDGAGHFPFQFRSKVGSESATLVTGDFNGDGKLYIIVASGPNVYTLAGNGDGTFASAHDSAGPDSSVITGIHVFDVNGDGKLDLLAANFCTGNGCGGGSRGVSSLLCKRP